MAGAWPRRASTPVRNLDCVRPPMACQLFDQIGACGLKQAHATRLARRLAEAGARVAPGLPLLPTDVSQLDAYPTDWTKGSPWVMWKGTPYAHIMVPLTSMAKSASKSPAEKKAADKK